MAGKTSIALFISLFLAASVFAQGDTPIVDGNVSEFLRNLEEAVGDMNTYRFITVSENWNAARHEKKTIMFQFKKPNLMRTDVLTGKKKGSTVVLNKDGVIRGKNSWGFRKTLKPKDKRLRNIRGMTFMNSNLMNKTQRLKEHILERGCKATLTEGEYEGRPGYHLHIDHEDDDDPITSEDVWFEKDTYLILKNIKYEGNVKVTDVTWRDHEVDIPLDDDLFEQ